MSLEKDTCYVGVSFYVAQDIDSTLTMRAQSASRCGNHLCKSQFTFPEPLLAQAVTEGLTPPQNCVKYVKSVFYIGGSHGI